MAENIATPVMRDAVEESVIVTGNRCDNWYRKVSSGDIYYAYSEDDYCENWTIGNNGKPLTLAGKFHPYVTRVSDVYYMAINNSNIDYDGNILLQSSMDKVNWTVLNDGEPILRHSISPEAWSYQLFNPAIEVIGDTCHLLVEGKSHGGNFVIGYSRSKFGDSVGFCDNLSILPVMSGYAGNPYLVHVPDRDALLVIYGDFDHNCWRLRASYGLLSTDLSVANNWIVAKGFCIQKIGINLSDPHLAISQLHNKPWNIMLVYNEGQWDGHRFYWGATLNEFYDEITNKDNTDSNYWITL